jgi:cell division septum initiation protein DivIVA
MPQPTPNWQPLSMLPMMLSMVSGMLDEVQTQLQSLRAAQERPHVLDDYTVGRVLKVYGEQQDFLWVYEAQLERWQQESLSAEQRQQTEQMAAQLAQLKPGLSEILAIANDLKDKTIESVLSKSDAELALDVLSGKLKPPF